VRKLRPLEEIRCRQNLAPWTSVPEPDKVDALPSLGDQNAGADNVVEDSVPAEPQLAHDCRQRIALLHGQQCK
jgi:hypothetical protein